MTWRKTQYHWKFAKPLLLKAIVQSLLSENNEAQQSCQAANWAFIMPFEKDGVLEVWWGFFVGFFFFLAKSLPKTRERIWKEKWIQYCVHPLKHRCNCCHFQLLSNVSSHSSLVSLIGLLPIRRTRKHNSTFVRLAVRWLQWIESARDSLTL